jgi:hypothetical protein
MEVAGWIKSIGLAGSRIPIYLGADLKRLKSAAPPETPEMKVQRLIRERKEDILAQLASLQIELEGVRNKCTHPNAVKQNNASTGNWDRSQDSYWKDCKCPDCGKSWREDQ